MCEENEVKEKLGETIEIDLSIPERNNLVTFCVKEHFDPISIQVFEDMILDGNDFKDAVYQAALNHMVVTLLEKYVDENPIPDDKNEKEKETGQD